MKSNPHCRVAAVRLLNYKLILSPTRIVTTAAWGRGRTPRKPPEDVDEIPFRCEVRVLIGANSFNPPTDYYPLLSLISLIASL